MPALGNKVPKTSNALMILEQLLQTQGPPLSRGIPQEGPGISLAAFKNTVMLFYE